MRSPLVREGLEHYPVDDAENRGTGTDPYRQGQHGDEGETGPLHHRADPIAQVLE